MNKNKSIFASFFMFLIVSCIAGCAASVTQNSKTVGMTETVTANEGASAEESDKNEKGTVVILATGGTIAGAGEAGKETGYKPGTLTVDSLINAIPGLTDISNIKAEQICNVNSDDITSEIWIELANRINEMAQDENISGFVITHGTDTMEETAFFLNLAVKTDKPVVLTGSMRPATAISADGSMNLYQAVCVAASKESRGKGVMVVFSDKIFSARSVKKVSTYNVMAISAGETGSIGVVRNNEVSFYEETTRKHTVDTEFDVKGVTKLPNVQIVYFAVDADPEMVKYAAEHADGLVIAGAGAGEFSEGFIDAINGFDIPVVISSRIDDGIITQDAVLCDKTVAANDLSPQKAVILLRLAIMNKTTTKDELVRLFDTY